MKKVMFFAMALCMIAVAGCKNNGKTPTPVEGETVNEAVEDAAKAAADEAAAEGETARDLALDALDEIKGSAEEAAEKALEEANDAVSFAAVEEKPTFNGGDANGFAKWVNQNINYPENAKEKGIEGRVILGFVVDAEGNVSDVKVLRGVDPELDAEALRVVKSSPKWEAGKQNGRNVKVTYTFPVVFQLK